MGIPMGNLTTFTVYNDSIHRTLSPENAVDFCDKLMRHASYDSKTSSDSDVIMQRTRHSGDDTVYVHMGNTVTEMNVYSRDTERLMKECPDFFEEILDHMESEVKELKEKYKRIKSERD